MTSSTPPARAEGRLERDGAPGAPDARTDSPLDDIGHLAARACDAPVALVALLERDRLRVVAGSGLTPLPGDIGPCDLASLAPGAPTVVVDARRDARLASSPLVLDA